MICNLKFCRIYLDLFLQLFNVIYCKIQHICCVCLLQRNWNRETRIREAKFDLYHFLCCSNSPKIVSAPMLDPPKVHNFWRIRYAHVILFEESEQYSYFGHHKLGLPCPYWGQALAASSFFRLFVFFLPKINGNNWISTCLTYLSGIKDYLIELICDLDWI